MGLRNFVDYRGHYLLDIALARARCRIEISGSPFDRERAREVLTERGWSPTSAHGTGPDDRDGFARDIRTGLGPGADAAVAQRLQADLEDGLCDAQVALVSIERIRYRQLRADHHAPGPSGLSYRGRPVDTLTTFVPAAPPSPETMSAPGTGSPNPEPTNQPSLLAGLIAGALTVAVKLSRKGIRIIYGQPWLLKWARRLTEEPPAYRNKRLAGCGIAAIVGLIAAACWVEVGDDNDLTRPFAWLVGCGALLLVVVALSTGLANLATRTILHSLPAGTALPEGYSRWRAAWWIDSSAASAIDLHHSQLIKRSATVAYLASALAGCFVAGTALWLLSQLVLGGLDQIAAVAATGCVLVICVLVIDMVRARHRSHTRPALARIASLLALLGLGGIILRLPAYAYFHVLGYPAVAFEISWHEAVLHADKFLIVTGVSALLAVAFWMNAPRLPRSMQTFLGLMMAIVIASAIVETLSQSERTAATIGTEKVTNSSATRIPACLIEGAVRKPIWVVSQPAGRLLIGDRGPGDPTGAVAITELRLIPASVTIQMQPDITCS